MGLLCVAVRGLGHPHRQLLGTRRYPRDQAVLRIVMFARRPRTARLPQSVNERRCIPRLGPRRRRRADDRRGRLALPAARRLRDARAPDGPRRSRPCAHARPTCRARPDAAAASTGSRSMRRMRERGRAAHRDHPAHRERRGVRPHHRPAARRRRLRRQAVLARRARRPGRRGAAPRRHRAPTRSRRCVFGGLVIDPPAGACVRRRRGGRAHPARVRPAAVPRPPPRARRSPATS